MVSITIIILLTSIIGIILPIAVVQRYPDISYKWLFYIIGGFYISLPVFIVSSIYLAIIL